MRTFREFCDAKLNETHFGARPAVHVVFDKPGLFYSWNKPVMRLGTADTEEVKGSFAGTVEIPVRDTIVKSAGDAGQDLGEFIRKIADEQQPSDLFDSPEMVVDFDNADFIGLPSYIDDIPESLTESLKEGFWQGVQHPGFKVVR